MPDTSIIERLHAGEINGSISWFFDGGWKVELGDPLNGIEAVDIVATYVEAEAWLDRKARELHPDSDFARS
jgi:hypothetical protein